jgi:2-polyprenyl-6-methoxyphenol hydroxylase-like FAD-dependent oxidoreductase
VNPFAAAALPTLLDVDAVVVGGGPAGAFATVLLTRNGLQVAQVVAPKPRPATLTEVLSPASLWALESVGLNLFPGIADSAITCRGVLSSWPPGGPDFHDFELTECRAGLSVERTKLQDALARTVSRTAAAAVVILGRLRRARQVSGHWHCDVMADDQSSFSLHADWIVDATGRGGSPCAPNAARRSFLDSLVSMSVTATANRIFDCLFVESSPQGWWYLAPSGHCTVHVVFVTDWDLAPRPRTHRAAWLEAQFRHTSLIRSALEPAPNFLHTNIGDARSATRSRYSLDGWLAIGDAAFSIDPLCGSGIFLALSGAQQACSNILRGTRTRFATHPDPYEAWCRHELRRQQDLRSATYSRTAWADHEFWKRRLDVPLLAPSHNALM